MHSKTNRSADQAYFSFSQISHHFPYCVSCHCWWRREKVSLRPVNWVKITSETDLLSFAPYCFCHTNFQENWVVGIVLLHWREKVTLQPVNWVKIATETDLLSFVVQSNFIQSYTVLYNFIQFREFTKFYATYQGGKL